MISEFVLQWWKAFTGKLRKESLCLDHSNSTITELPEFPKLCKNKTLTTLSAGVEMQFSDIEMLHEKEIWYAELSGSSLKVAVTSESKNINFCVLVLCHISGIFVKENFHDMLIVTVFARKSLRI